MRWDDLQLLHLIDDLEESEPAAVSSGFQLMDRAGRAWDRQIDYTIDPPLLVHELLIARVAGLLTFDDLAYGSQIADPNSNAHYWLQQIRDIHLTPAGRDRARSRVFISPLPDPDEDDHRLVTGATIEEIARAVGDTFTAFQLPRFLRDSGVPSEFVPDPLEGDKWQYVMYVLESLLEGGSAARRSFRTFVGQWLAGALHAPPSTKVRTRIVALLGQQGWHVRDGVLVIGERITLAPGALTPLSRDARIAALHADIRQATERFLDDHLDVAIFEAFKAVNLRVKAMSGLNLDGSDLMAKAFSIEGHLDPAIRLADLSSETGKNIQTGFRFIFMGAVRGIRNPDAHELFEPMNDEEAFEELSLASMLMRRLDAAKVK
jgi:uncharacterized protein (TIGR02391 family)